MSLTDTIKDKRLKEIADKVTNNIPVDEADAIAMLTTNSILDLGGDRQLYQTAATW